MRKAYFRGKLEVLEVDFKSHSCLYCKVPFGGHDRINIDFFLGLGIKKVASSPYKVHSGIVESHGAVFKYHRKFYHGGFIDQFFAAVS